MADNRTTIVLEGEQLAVATAEQVGNIISDRGDQTVEALVSTSNGNQLAVKTVAVDGGGTPLYKKIIIKDTTIPVASAANANEMYIYAGQTNATYTHGYIYENQYIPSYAGSITFDPATISVSDADYGSFLTAGIRYIENPTTITHGTMTYHGASAIWRMECYDANDTLVGARQLYQSDYEDAGFVFTGTFSDGDVVNFTTSIEVAASSYQWVRIDVQPGGGSVKFVPELPAEGEEQYIYGVIRDEFTRDDYAIVQLFMWHNDQWEAASAYDIDLKPGGLVYESSFNTSTNTWTVTVNQVS